MKAVNVGIIGCGNISGIYFQNTTQFDILNVIAGADLIPERIQAKADQYPIKSYPSGAELLKDPDIEFVINLTTPPDHAQICLEALEAGKHVYVEKPLSVTREDGQRILKLAAEKGLYVGGAPDTFLGAGIQTCRKLLDEGVIGTPVAATAFMMIPGHESWHPDPEFYYKVGGGPMFDMGPYYLTALVNLLGPIRRVTGSAQISFPQRTITSEPKHGTKIDVEVPTHVAGVLDFVDGPVGTIITSFDVSGAKVPFIEIYGSEGTLSVPDPNTFGGPVVLRRRGEEEQEISLTHGYAENSRGLGVADMAYAIRSGRPYRANSQVQYHVLEVMHGFHDASASGKHYEVQSSCQRPEAFPEGHEGESVLK